MFFFVICFWHALSMACNSVIRSNHNDNMLAIEYIPNVVSSDTSLSTFYCEPPDPIQDSMNSGAGLDIVPNHTLHKLPDIIYTDWETVFDGQDLVECVEYTVDNRDQYDQGQSAQEGSSESHSTLTGQNGSSELDIATTPNVRDAVATRDQSTQTEKKPYECDICGKRFGYKKCLNTHKTKQTKSGLSACSGSSSKLNGKGNVTRDLKARQPQKKPYKCDISAKSLNNKKALPRHKRKDTTGGLFACPDCGKSFNDSSNLLRHVNVHTRVIEYECGICIKKFLQKSNLIKHEKRHRGEKDYVCNTCNQSFVTRSELNLHKKCRRRTGNVSFLSGV